MGRTGVLLVGAYGSISLCTIIGTLAQKRGLSDSTGMVSELPFFAHLDLADHREFVFAGWDIRDCSLEKSAEELYSVTRSIRRDILDAVLPELRAIEPRIRPGTSFGLAKLLSRFPDAKLVKETASASLERLREDIRQFKSELKLDAAIVVNIASTEPLREFQPEWDKLDRWQRAIEKNNEDAISPSLLYAYAALLEHCPYVNFTPSPSAEIPALRELSEKTGVPIAGKDGKTGETLMKTVLAPMFTARNMKVLSWEGFNMLGNRDGLVLDDPGSNSAKTANKDGVLRGIIRDPKMHTRTRIDYVPSLDDWKVAMDYIHFEGFLGTRMSLSFQWQGCDSMLAAPLVLDLIRFTDHAARHRERPVLKHLSCFFKNPFDCTTHDFSEQFRILVEHYRP